MDPFTALQIARSVKKTIDIALLKDRVGKIEKELDHIDQRLADDYEAFLRAGFECLYVADQTAVEGLRTSELSNARHSFSQMRIKAEQSAGLLERQGKSVEVISAVAYAGEFFCLTLLGDRRLAAISAYASTELFPRLGAEVFPCELFSRDYARAFGKIERSRRAALAAHQIDLDRYRIEMAEYRADMKRFTAKETGRWAVKVGAATGVGIASALVCCVNPGYAGSAFHNVRSTLREDYLHNDVPKPLRPERRPTTVVVDTGKTEELQRRLVRESRTRRAALEAAGTPERTRTER